jgi:tripartite-type tricarboxylate transporter receptor subunit TctC
MHRREFIAFTSAAALFPLVAPSALRAQTGYPSGPIKLVVPFAAGGVVDVLGRQWAEKVKPLLGTVYIENIGGAGGVVGASAVSRSKSDGLTLLFGDTSTLVLAPYLQSRSYDPAKDLVPIANVAHSASSIVVNPNVPVKSFEEFTRYLKERNERVTYASAGIGTVTHLAAESLKQTLGVSGVVHAPYRGMGPALVDVMGGVVEWAAPNMTQQVLELHKSNKIRLLAVCSKQRLKAAPSIQTASETLPGFEVQLGTCVVAPPGVAEPILLQIAKATEQVVNDPTFRQTIEEAGQEIGTLFNPDAASEFWAGERTKLYAILKAAGVQPQ